MLDISGWEFLTLAIIAVIIFGPDKLPKFAADAGRMMKQVRNYVNGAKDELTRELGPEFKDISMADLNPRTLVRKHLIEPLDLDDMDGVGRTGSAGPRNKPAATGEGTPPPYDEDAT